MVDAWTLVRFLHVLSAMIWVGGQLLLSLLVLRCFGGGWTPPAGRR